MEQDLINELNRRERNYSLLNILNKGICPSCNTRSIEVLVNGNWSCPECKRVYYSNYEVRGKNVKKK